MLEIIFHYSQDIGPFKSFFWTDILQIRPDTITFKEITQDVLVTCLVIVSDHNVKLVGHFQNLGRTMSHDRLLFPALLLTCVLKWKNSRYRFGHPYRLLKIRLSDMIHDGKAFNCMKAMNECYIIVCITSSSVAFRMEIELKFRRPWNQCGCCFIGY